MDITLKDAAAASACMMPPSLGFGSSAPNKHCSLSGVRKRQRRRRNGEEWRVSTLFLLRRVGGASGEVKRACDKNFSYTTHDAQLGDPAARWRVHTSFNAEVQGGERRTDVT